MNKFWIITKDVYRKNVRTWSFIIMLLIPIVAGGGFYLISKIASNQFEMDKIGVVSTLPEFETSLKSVENSSYEFESFSSEDAAKKALRKEKIDGYLIVTGTKETLEGTIYTTQMVDQQTQLVIGQLLTYFQEKQRAATFNLTPEKVAYLTENAQINVKKIHFDDDGQLTTSDDQGELQGIVSLVTTILLFIFILTYANIIAQEIASEKGTRIMEVILSSTKASTHFFGKITGILLVALTQFVAYGVMGIGAYFYFKDNPMVKAILAEIPIKELFSSFLLLTVVFILLGIFIYSVLAALCGSLVNRPEDTAKVILPVTYLSLAGYMIGLTLGAGNPNHFVIRITSYIPFLSSYTMPIRLAHQMVSPLEVLISILILAVTTIGLTYLSAKMYRSNVLIYNDKGIWSSLKQSFILLQNEKSVKR